MNWTRVVRVALIASVLVVGATAFSGGAAAAPAAVDGPTLSDTDSTDCAGTVCEVLCLGGKFNCPHATGEFDTVTTAFADTDSTNCASVECRLDCLTNGYKTCPAARGEPSSALTAPFSADSTNCVGVECTAECVGRVVKSTGKELDCKA